jgi:predicted transcriptional regulator
MPTMYETATNEILPAIRSYIAKELMKHGMSEEKIANLLGVAQAAISKYVNEKYSEKVKEIESKIDTKIIDAYITKMLGGEKVYVNACICKICQSICAFDCVFSNAEVIKTSV